MAKKAFQPIAVEPPNEVQPVQESLIPDNPLASFDLGNANAKVKTADVSAEFRSIAGRLSRSQRFSELHTKLVFTFDGETLVFGNEARDLIDGEPVAYTDMSRYTSGFYRKLFAAALWRSFQHRAKDGVIFPTIVCSIPIMEYANGKADDVKQKITGPYVIDGLDGVSLYATVKPENLLIIPEGAGSYYNALAAGSGLGSQTVAILDVGFYTTDLIVFNRGNYVPGAARSTKHGVQQVADAVYQHLFKNEHYNGDLWAVDNALDTGTIEIANRCVGFTDQRDDAYADLTDDLLTFYYSSIGSRTPGSVLLSGGGANNTFKFLPANLQTEGWRVISKDPRRDNIDGAYQFLEGRQKKQRGANG